MTRLRADLLLLLAAMIWGTGFVAQKTGMQTLSPMAFVGFRFLASTCLLAPLAFWETRVKTRPLTRHNLLLAVAIGLCLSLAMTLQQTALQTTSVTNAGFLTSLYMAFVPFVGFIVSRIPLRPIVLFACALSLLGAWLLSSNGHLSHAFSHGDMLLLISDIVWAIHITLIARFQAEAERPFLLSFIQYVITGLSGLAFGMSDGSALSLMAVQTALPAILYAGLISGGIAFTLQIIAQRYTPAAEASLIMALEGAFAALAGACFLGERLTPLGALGCGMIFLGVVMVEVGPLLRSAPRAQ